MVNHRCCLHARDPTFSTINIDPKTLPVSKQDKYTSKINMLFFTLLSDLTLYNTNLYIHYLAWRDFTKLYFRASWDFIVTNVLDEVVSGCLQSWVSNMQSLAFLQLECVFYWFSSHVFLHLSLLIPSCYCLNKPLIFCTLAPMDPIHMPK